MTHSGEANVRVYRAGDASPGALAGERVALLGYGYLRRTAALNLRDSGIKIRVGNRQDEYAIQARADGFDVVPLDGAAGQPIWSQLMGPCIGHSHRHLGELESAINQITLKQHTNEGGLDVADYYSSITDEQAALIRNAPLFFVASVDPNLAKGPNDVGPVNLSPKGGVKLHLSIRDMWPIWIILAAAMKQRGMPQQAAP